MFTGIIEETGSVKAVSSNEITIECCKILEDCKLGDSISVNGVCLTVSNLSNTGFTADVSPETIRVTDLSGLKSGDAVNLERAMTLSARFGGHIVSGHIDTVGKIQKVSKLNDFYEISIGFDREFSKYIVKKGSIAVDGISLTIADCTDSIVTIAVIPHTYENTVLKARKSGDNVNIEFDILAKYVEKKLSSSDNNNITVDFLAEKGFI